MLEENNENNENNENEIGSIDDLRNVEFDSGETDEGNEEVSTESDAFEPNYSYKVKDEEFEFDDRVKSIIKTKEDEDYFRDIYTRADGINTYKQKISDYESKVNELTDGVNELSNGFHRIKELRDNDNIQELMHTLGIKEESIVNYALELAKQQALPQEERERINKVQTFERENRELKTRLNSLETQFQTTAQQSEAQRDFQELTNVVSENSNLAKAMESKGLNLQSEIINTGMSEFGRRGQDISIQDAFNIVKQKYGWLEEVNIPKIDRKESLPVIKGTSSAHISDEITSIEQLQKLYDSKFN